MNPPTPPAKVLGFVGWLGLCFAAAAVGAFATAHAGAFYQALARPSWAPPGWLFGPVWTLLYLLMAVSAWLVWAQAGFRKAAWALSLFLVQLGVNALWSWLFFFWHRGLLAFAEILLLWLLILATGIGFWRQRRLAAVLLLPYWAWVSFAAALAWAVWRGNPHRLG